MAVEHHFEIDQGGSWSQPLDWQDSTETPHDLTNYTAQFTIRKKYADIDTGDPVVVLTETEGITLDDSTPNIVLELTESDTAAIPYGTYVYDLKLDDGQTVTKLLRGTVFVIAGVG